MGSLTVGGSVGYRPHGRLVDCRPGYQRAVAVWRRIQQAAVMAAAGFLVGQRPELVVRLVPSWHSRGGKSCPDPCHQYPTKLENAHSGTLVSGLQDAMQETERNAEEHALLRPRAPSLGTRWMGLVAQSYSYAQVVCKETGVRGGHSSVSQSCRRGRSSGRWRQ